MSWNFTYFLYSQKIGNPKAKSVLMCIDYLCERSVTEIAQWCELTIKDTVKALNYLMENNIIRLRDGYIESEKGKIFQFEILLKKPSTHK